MIFLSVVGVSIIAILGAVYSSTEFFDAKNPETEIGHDINSHRLECLEGGGKKWIDCSLPAKPYMLITSDLHISSPIGRWPDTTKKFKEFLGLFSKAPPEKIFIVGDVVDNAIDNYPGSIENWRNEWALFQAIKESFPFIVFQQSYGSGHDWLNDEMLDELDRDQGPRNGFFEWRGVKFIWLSFGPAAFVPGDEFHGSDLRQKDYDWLEEMLVSVPSATLLFHVPLVTPESRSRAMFSGGRLIAVDPRDRLYSILSQYSEKIDQIFSGHIHQIFRHEFEGVDYFSCPFIDNRGFCTIEISNEGILTRMFRWQDQL